LPGAASPTTSSALKSVVPLDVLVSTNEGEVDERERKRALEEADRFGKLSFCAGNHVVVEGSNLASRANERAISALRSQGGDRGRCLP
jgi:hypothetical protein